MRFSFDLHIFMEHELSQSFCSKAKPQQFSSPPQEAITVFDE